MKIDPFLKSSSSRVLSFLVIVLFIQLSLFVTSSQAVLNVVKQLRMPTSGTAYITFAGSLYCSADFYVKVETTDPLSYVQLTETGSMTPINASVSFGTVSYGPSLLVKISPYFAQTTKSYTLTIHSTFDSYTLSIGTFTCKSPPSSLTIKSSSISGYVEDGTWVVEATTTVDYDLIGTNAILTCSTFNYYQCVTIYPLSTSTSTIPMRFKVTLNPSGTLPTTQPTSELISITISTITITNPIISLSLYPSYNIDVAKYTTNSSLTTERSIARWEQSSYHYQLNVNSSTPAINDLQLFSADGQSIKFLRKVFGNSNSQLTYFKEFVLSSTRDTSIYQVASGGYAQLSTTTFPITILPDTTSISQMSAGGWSDGPFYGLNYLQTQMSTTFLDENVNMFFASGMFQLYIPAPFGNHRASQTLIYRPPFVLPPGLPVTILTMGCLGTTTQSGPSNGKTVPGGTPTPPIITNVEYFPFTGYSCLVKIDYQTSVYTGMRSVSIYGGTTVIGPSSIISGTAIGGSVMTEFKLNPTQLQPVVSTIILTDSAGVSVLVMPGQFLSADNFVPFELPIPQLYLRPANITSVKFIPNDIDTSFGPTTVTMLFTVSDAMITSSLASFNVTILLTKLNADGQFGSRSISSLAYVDPKFNSYRIDFILPQNLGNDTIEYFFNKYTHSTTLISKLGPSSQLRVKSNNLDKFPPMITNIKPIFSTSRIQFNLSIVDRVNGLDYGLVNITSDMDPLPRTFVLGASTLVNGSMYEGDHSIGFDFDASTCITQTFKITGLYLVDRSGWSSFYPVRTKPYPSQYNFETLVDPFLQLDSDPEPLVRVVAPCPARTQYGAPVLNELIADPRRIDVGTNDRNISFVATFKTPGGTTPISPRHQPNIYLLDDVGNYFIISPVASEIGPTGLLAKYTYLATLPYGFGAVSNLSVSVYGTFDTNMNTQGFSASEIMGQNSSNPYFINTTYSLTLSNSLVLKYAQSDIPRAGGVVVLVGGGMNQFYTTQSTTVVAVIDEPGFSKSYPVSFTSPISCTFTIPTIIPASLASIRITLKSSALSLLSLPFAVSVKDYVAPYTPPAIVPCPSGCGGSDHGTCGDNGCACINGWYGPTCSQTTIQVIPNITKTEPTVVIGNQNTTSSTTDRFIYSIVSIVSIREIEMDGTTYKEYPLDNWAYSNQTMDMSKSINYLYNSTLSIPTDSTNSSFTNTTISVSVQWFRDAQEISFGNQPISLPPSSTKINIGIDQYPFQSITNTLQIIMDISINIDDDGDDACSELDYGLGNGNDENDVQWVKLKVGGSSIYARFIRSGIIDGRQSVIQNSVVEKQESSGTRQFIGINVPYYSNYAQLDPDLSMLVDNGDSDYECGKKPTLSKPQLAGIIVGGCVLIIACSILIGWYIRKKYSIRFTKGKLEMINMR
ncbi:hypothetical protein DFA_11150 [Cavenderia fasciculata]|uniref:EGF-like domain-containing protein n=1 Tax=Cavenderia fasciculata TaxID=261658 RepID=F4QF30_CACFS|nr:uncharacterized protein DFA_11150 [Cavenderia fasciculata]EGG13389.1 hypothetical protein DFA_11150 [Cavenderia fasciculata]|eukprot:XP_004350093.1 hypothetical protein DFA_11150 [Cavenderia fasciculata]